ncbi:RNA-binding protein [Candidatus Woesearchaeota archaeon]|nr:RNA-binding protein [Candidatus Woesearchaeota archaeon]
MEEIHCLSCKRRVTNVKGTTRFICPSCGKYEIVRCTSCRETAIRYICPECRFSGPN